MVIDKFNIILLFHYIDFGMWVRTFRCSKSILLQNNISITKNFSFCEFGNYYFLKVLMLQPFIFIKIQIDWIFFKYFLFFSSKLNSFNKLIFSFVNKANIIWWRILLEYSLICSIILYFKS